MAGIRDPAFWHRFSVAVHLDEEKGNISPADGAASPAASRPSELKHTDTWLRRNAKKRAKMRRIGWAISLSLVIIIAAVVLVVLWLKGNLIPAPSSSTSPSPPPSSAST